MALSESAEKGRKAASSAAALCRIASLLSLLSLDIPLAIIGLWTAGNIKAGSLAARDIAVILRIVDVFILLLAGLLLSAFGGLPTAAAAVIMSVCGLLDIILLSILLGSKDLNAYLHEMSDGVE